MLEYSGAVRLAGFHIVHSVRISIKMRSIRSKCRWKLQTGAPFFVLLPLLIVFSGTRTYGTSYRTPAAIESNLLAFDGKLAFIQGSGGLTVLDLRTGQVKLRKMLRDEFGRIDKLIQCPEGVLLVGYRKLSLVDPNTFAHRWTIKDCCNPIVEGPYLVSCDNYQTVRCYDSVTGVVRWSKELQGGWNFALSDGVLVVSTVSFYDRQSALWVIDAESGKQLFHKTPPQGKQWCDVHCDGKAIYAITAPRESSDFQATPNGIIKYDLQGQEVESLDFSSPLITKSHKQFKYPFLLEGKAFARNENCRKAYPHELDPQAERLAPNGFSVFSLPTGTLVHEESKDFADEKGHTIRLLSTDGPWKNYLPFVRPNEYLGPVEEVDGRILLCWSGVSIARLGNHNGCTCFLRLGESCHLRVITLEIFGEVTKRAGLNFSIEAWLQWTRPVGASACQMERSRKTSFGPILPMRPLIERRS